LINSIENISFREPWLWMNLLHLKIQEERNSNNKNGTTLFKNKKTKWNMLTKQVLPNTRRVRRRHDKSLQCYITKLNNDGTTKENNYETTVKHGMGLRHQ